MIERNTVSGAAAFGVAGDDREYRAAAQERAVEAAIYAFFRALDDGDFDAVADAIHANGVWHRQGKALRGPTMVRGAMSERPKALTTAHLVTNVLVQFDRQGDADARFWMTVLRHEGPRNDSEPAPMELPFVVTSCKATLTRECGAWRFLKLAADLRFRRGR